LQDPDPHKTTRIKYTAFLPSDSLGPFLLYSLFIYISSVPHRCRLLESFPRRIKEEEKRRVSYTIIQPGITQSTVNPFFYFLVNKKGTFRMN
jgi:hypothetical protein